MKIQLTQHGTSGHTPCRHLAARWLGMVAVVAFGIAGNEVACAQSNSAADSDPSSETRVSSIRNGLFTLGNESYRVVDTAAFRTAADLGETEAGSIAQVGFCRGGACGSACRGDCGPRWMSPCAPCEPFAYVLAEALYLDRDGDENFTTAANFQMRDFGFEWAGRITAGFVPDCVHGCEVSFTGLFEWDRAGSAIDAGGGLSTLFTPGAPFTPAHISAFNNATFQSQLHEAEYWSLEANKTLVGWDMAKLLIGGRYIDYEELFNYTSQNATETGVFLSNTENKLWGLQIGMDLLYPVCRHGYSDFRARLGGFLNFAESDVVLVNDGNVQLANSAEDEDLAGVFEMSAGLRYRFGEVLSVRFGTELWYLANVANATEQFSTVITPATGRLTNIDDDILITGFSVGAELRY